MESSGGVLSTVADTTARSTQPDANTGPSITLVSFTDTQSIVTRPSVLPSMYPTSTANATVLVRKRG